MRTLLSLFAFTILFNVNAQQKNLQEQKQQFSPEQIAELQTKKMELDFELNEKQRKEIYNLNLELAQKRQQNLAEMKARKSENKAFTSDEKYEKELKRLDEQKNHQAEMKRILGEEKYKVWKENHREEQLNRKKLFQNKRSEYRQKGALRKQN
ncbi:MAG TPA: hypothetical protein VFY09_03160 [Flavobacteriaceae bacterium]|nr:hypothetical protein [Flavobacteriaceae bacterium]HEX5742882.1 hypothetical protein [Flavobacteriaceae bacterium]